MNKLISGWTEQHVPVALALAAAVLAGAVAATQPGPLAAAALALVVTTALGALFFDAFGGLVVGVITAALFVLAMQAAGQWTPRSFATSLAQVLGLVVLGWLAGMLSAAVHGRSASRPDADVGVVPAYGSLGLLTEDVALARLDDEIARARRHRRPLTVVVIRMEMVDDTLGERARKAAVRAVARLVETLLRETDVPFALDSGELGAILPETDTTAAWDILGPVLDAASGAAFTVRDEDERRSLVDCAELHAGMAELGQHSSDANGLIASARTTARDDERERPDVRLPSAPGTTA